MNKIKQIERILRSKTPGKGCSFGSQCQRIRHFRITFIILNKIISITVFAKIQQPYIMEPQELYDIPDQYLCPIMRVLMEEPVLTIDGHTFERKAIEEWFKRGNWRNPLTNMKLGNRILVPNLVLKRLIESFRQKLPEIQRKEREKADLQYIISQMQEWYKNDLQKKSIKQKMTMYEEDFKMFKQHFQIKRKQFHHKFSFQSGNYQGQATHQMPNGLGIHYCSDGGRYEGSFVNGKREGKGMTYYCNGDRFQGQFRKGEPFGSGIAYYEDGSRFAGEFRGFLKNGKGLLYRSDGKIVEQYWQQGIKK